MPLPESFLFSQGSLQDYTDCQRRFYLKHLRKLAWPSIESEPIKENEHFRLQGELFHKMAHQFFVGIPPEKLTAMTLDPILALWWENFLTSQKDLIGTENAFLYPELAITIPIKSFRLLAKVDLLLLKEDGNCLIYDWKTYRKRPRREHLAQRLQTRVYPYSFVNLDSETLSSRASGFIMRNNHPLPDSSSLKASDFKERSNFIISPEKITMIYWFTNFPDQPEIFRYSRSQYQKDARFLSNLINSIAQSASSDLEEAFPLTPNPDRCLFCTYRSLCDRGIRAGDWEGDQGEAELPDSLEDFDFDHVSETEF